MKTKKELQKECTEKNISYAKKETNASLIEKLTSWNPIEIFTDGNVGLNDSNPSHKLTITENPDISSETTKIEDKIRKIDTIILHCSDSDVKTHDDISVIKEWHTLPVEKKGRGWSDVGYHFFIKSNGVIQTGRTLETIGAHAKGYNETSIGICVHGKRYFTAKSMDALVKKCRELIKAIPTIKNIIGHNEVSDKSCPNFSTKRFKNLLNG